MYPKQKICPSCGNDENDAPQASPCLSMIWERKWYTPLNKMIYLISMDRGPSANRSTAVWTYLSAPVTPLTKAAVATFEGLNDDPFIIDPEFKVGANVTKKLNVSKALPSESKEGDPRFFCGPFKAPFISGKRMNEQGNLEFYVSKSHDSPWLWLPVKNLINLPGGAAALLNFI